MTSSIAPGHLVLGKYRIERVLGEGGMGRVLAAYQPELDRRIALKVLLPELTWSAEFVARFLREAQAAATLESRHVARIHDLGRFEDGTPFIVMELLEGRDLSRELEVRGPLPVEETVEYLLQACDALAEAHALGIVHRDLKPANLYLTKTRDGLPCVKVLDFGISKVRAPEGTPNLTNARSMLGTPHYMPPEQLRTVGAVDQRADVWALGVTAFELLSGARPFEGEDLPTIVARILAEPPTPLSSLRPDVPAALERAIMRCLSKDVAERFASVHELAVALGAYAPERARAGVDRISRVVEGTAVWAPLESAAGVPPAHDGPVVEPEAGPAPAGSARPASSTNVVVSRDGAALPKPPWVDPTWRSCWGLARSHSWAARLSC